MKKNTLGKTLYKAIKWLFVIAAFSYLAYKLITFDKYDVFISEWRSAPLSRFGWLAVALALLPLNLSIEALKWKALIKHVQELNFVQSLKSILSGITTGFFTPNRIGDMIGRIAFLKTANKASGVTLSLVSSLTQNITILLAGVPACILFFLKNENNVYTPLLYITVSLLLFFLLGLLYLKLPQLSCKLQQTKPGAKINRFIAPLSDYTTPELIKVVFISFARYIVFSFQFFCMLRFFNVSLSLWQAFLTIPTYYLFVTFTPSIAFSEAATRASYAILLFGAFSTQYINIALAGVAIWFVNWAIPLAIGAVMFLRSKD